MHTIGIVMRPMDQAALAVPFIHPAELHPVAFLQPCHSRRDVYVVGDQQRLSGGESHYESLMTAALVVIGQDANDRAYAGDLDPVLMFFEGGGKSLITGKSCLGTASRRASCEDPHE